MSFQQRKCTSDHRATTEPKWAQLSLPRLLRVLRPLLEHKDVKAMGMLHHALQPLLLRRERDGVRLLVLAALQHMSSSGLERVLDALLGSRQQQ